MATTSIDIINGDVQVVFYVTNASDGSKITSGTVTLRIYELQSDGTLHQFDFDDNTFKDDNWTTPSGSLTHQSIGSGTDINDTGLWTGSIDATDFNDDTLYYFEVEPSDSNAINQIRVMMFDSHNSVDNYYQIELSHTITSSQDQYTVSFFKNTELITSGVSTPKISAIKRSNGATIFSNATLTAVGTSFKYDVNDSSKMIQLGETYIVTITATIDGLTRTISKLVTRDE